MALTIADIAAASYPAVVNARDKAANQWAESAFLRELQKQGGLKRVDFGPTIEVTLDYVRNSGAAILATPFTSTSTSATAVIGAASYAVAEVSVPVNWSKADDAKNPSQNQKIDYVTALLDNAMASHDDILEATLFATSNGLVGFSDMITEDGTGTIGGIVSGTDTMWKNKFDEWTDDSDIEAVFTSVWNLCAKGSGSGLAPTLIVSGADTQAIYESTLQTNQRFIDSSEANGGFKVLAFKNARYVFSKAGGESAYFLNPKSYQVLASRSHFRMKGDTQEHYNANAYNFKIYSAVQAITNNRSRLGVAFS